MQKTYFYLALIHLKILLCYYLLFDTFTFTNYLFAILLAISPSITGKANLFLLHAGPICSENSCVMLSAAATSSPSDISEQMTSCQVNTIFLTYF